MLAHASNLKASEHFRVAVVVTVGIALVLPDTARPYPVCSLPYRRGVVPRNVPTKVPRSPWPKGGVQWKA